MCGKRKRHPEQIIEEWYFVGKCALVLLAAAVVLFLWKGDALIHGEIGCIYWKALGFYCPGCGGTRAFYYLVHGNLWRSFLCNPFVPYMVGVYTFFMGNTFFYVHTIKVGFHKFPIMALIYTGVGLLLGQCVVRNILYLGFGLTIL